MSITDWLLNPTGLTPHGFCLSWAPGLVGLHAASDAVIGLAYFSIPLALASFIGQRRDIQYGWVAYLFVAFIMACGTTHLLAILTLWVPAYGVEGLIKVLTAVLSIVTAALLWPLIPKAVALPSAAQLASLNSQLTTTIEEQARTTALLRESETRVRQSNLELESRVAERTAELLEANLQLTDALAQRDLLLREVYHRVKNNLQTVDGLIVMQARQVVDPEAKKGLLNLRSRIFALGLVHQQLMGSDDLKTFDFAPFLRELSENIVEGGAGSDVTLSVDAVPLNVGLDFAIPLGLLVTELVTNSLKHAFPDGKGAIDVLLQRNDDATVALVVADNGGGGKTAAPANDGRPALGTSIIRGLVAQLKGTMVVRHENGTRSEIHLPAPVTA
ncbi:sensor histidine kinase [Phenylobacterium sp. LjRoot225]|uniref:sensor histidine kinase n=1 Tax=Phenylobacterium sp. LjRoot225 TaxID=3342285 RepID=UPI003ECC84C8